MSALCAMHALNNAVGMRWQSPEDMEFALVEYMAEAAREGNEERLSDHMSPGGWYSSEVLAFAVTSTTLNRAGCVKFAMKLEPLKDNPQNIHHITGAVVNQDNRHWVAIRSVGSNIWLHNSLEEHPRMLSDNEYRSFISAFPHAYPMTVASREVEA